LEATNAPAGFQRIMNDSSEESLDDYVLVYLDDTLIFEKNDKDGDEDEEDYGIYEGEMAEVDKANGDGDGDGDEIAADEAEQQQKSYFIDSDASDKVIGGILQQYHIGDDGKERLHPLAYESKKLTETEQNYSAQEREMLAIMHCLRHWRHIVEGQKIYIRLGKLQVVQGALSRISGLHKDCVPADVEFSNVEEDDDGYSDDDVADVFKADKQKQKKEHEIFSKLDLSDGFIQVLHVEGNSEESEEFLDAMRGYLEENVEIVLKELRNSVR
jgi:RNase H-like domain found in reverse transcriptase